MTPIDLAGEVRTVFERVRAADPDAYSGYVSDAAVKAVARRHNLKATDVLRAYRAKYPATGRKYPPPGARQPSADAKALAV